MKKTIIAALFVLLLTGCSAVKEGTKADRLKEKEVLLLNMEGEDGSTVFLDSSNNPKKVKAHGNAGVSVEQARSGKSSLHLDGGLSNYVTIQNSPDWDFGDGDFTIDCWFYITDSNGQKTIFAGDTDWWLGAWFVGKHGNLMNYYASSTGTSWDLISDRYDQYGGGEGSIYITPNEWHHFAYVRYGDVWTGYIDGKRDFTRTISGTLIKKDEVKRIGLWGNSTYGFDGYIDDFRVTKGAARWTDEFTPEGLAPKKKESKITRSTPVRGTKRAVKMKSVPVETEVPVEKTKEEYFDYLSGRDNLKQNEAVRAFIKSGKEGKEYLLMKKQQTTDEEMIWKIDAVLSQMEKQ